MNKRRFLAGGSVMAFSGGVSLLRAQPAMAADPFFYAGQGGYAADGADVVAYRDLNASSPGVPGSKTFSTNWKGARWRFANAENLARFEGDPKAYAPQYGGYCAWAVSQGYTAHGDIDAWHIENGRLYLNYNQRIRTRWRRDVPGNIARANANWPNVLNA
ncbi:MAG: YHS domain-containing (seleno)protein [Pseudomonadota bacterium]